MLILRMKLNSTHDKIDNMNKIIKIVSVAAMSSIMLTGCNIYKKFEMPKESELG